MKPDTEIIIIGTGFSGICMGIKLKEEGINSFIILEKAADIGGTWRDNTYPGCACDIKSHLYSYSFEPNPDWSRKFSPQPEIWDYLKHCVTKYGLTPHIRFGWEMKAARYDDDSCTWTLHNAKSEQLSAKIFILGAGGLHIPSIPNIRGIGSFTGKLFHSAQWDHTYDLNGKTVAVIGTGASSIQFVPEIVPRVKKLYLFQRTAPWVLPKPDGQINGFSKKLFRLFPLTQKLARGYIYSFNEFWAIGFNKSRTILKVAEWLGMRHLKQQVKDEKLRRKLTPHFPIGCKRILFSNNYYPSLTQPHVEVVTDAIESIGKDFIRTADGTERKTDAILCGTGFHVIDSFQFINISGSKGLRLSELWKEKPEAFLGTTVHGFPNLFFLTGPNTGLGHNSVIYIIESQVAYIMDCIRMMQQRSLKYLNVKKEVQDAFNRMIDKLSENTVFRAGCKSWYITASGKNPVIWPGYTFTFRRLTKRMKPEHYEMGI